VDAPALQRCVGEVDRFFERYWAQAPLVAEGASQTAFDDLASLDDLDRMVTSLGLDSSSFRMVKGGKTLAPSSYSTASRVNGSAVYERFSEGATIVLESLHRYWPPLTDFCRALEMALGHRLQVNAYITPPGSQGFDVHRDSHDVFVLQVFGRKHWVVYDRDMPERVLIDRDIERGTSLYIPEGFPHAASTGDGPSAHLTVGILTHESIDVFREVMKVAESDPLFRQRLPVHRVSDLEALRETVETEVDEMRAWLDKLDIDELTDRMARRVFATAQPIVRGQLRQFQQLDRVDGNTTLVRRRGAICLVSRKGEALRVLLADRELEMPSVVEAAMGEIARRETFQVRVLFDTLDEASAIVLVKRLVREGLLEAVLD
jgi:bifunctional lysine-specific demethylase and histidyl-hydroxylase NO66